MEKAKVDFDQFAENYNQIGNENLKKTAFFWGGTVDYFAEQRIKLAKRLSTVEPKKILDFGCGIGNNIPFLLEYFKDSEVFGCDIFSKTIDHATSLYPKAKFFLLDQNLPDEQFDLITIFAVFHHIAVNQRKNVLSQISRLLKKDGMILVAEHNPYNPVTRNLVKNCPYDEDAVLLTKKEAEKLLDENGFKVCEGNYMFFLPKFLSIEWVEQKLGFIPMGGQYYLKAMKK